MDKARETTDKHLEKMEKKLKKHYKRASRDLYNYFNEYMQSAKKEITGIEKLIEQYRQQGKGTKQIEKRLQQKKKEVTLQTKRYNEIVENLTRQIANVNKTALEYINGNMPPIYTINYNQVPAGFGAVEGIRFDLVSEHVIRRRILDGDLVLPKREINVAKDMQWNTRQINSSVLQGILNGESMDGIADRINPIVNNNAMSALRIARTMVTGAENQGRNDRYSDLENKGILMNKVWIATEDRRTRHWHLVMDGQEVGIHDKFTDGNGARLRYPGDTYGDVPPNTVYNCRCSMGSHIIGFLKPDGRIVYV